jgi:hypothetical protein
MRRPAAFLARPLLDVFRGLDGCLARGGGRALLAMAAAMLVGFWLYVPAHELLHAAGCLATGGTVSRLEVREVFGGALLARLVPWVEPGGDYAGRLSGFDTGGSDLVYLATDLAPFALTLLPGVWLLRRAGRRRRAALFGLALPVALAPFLSATGDAYEIGSILVTRLPPWADAATRELLRGDDLFRQLSQLAAAPPPAPWGGAALAAALGLAWAFLTYALGGLLARALGEPPLPPVPPPGPAPSSTT